MTFEERFWAKVDKSAGHGPGGDCWVWTAARSKFGHGVFSDKNRRFLGAHRASWKINRGDPGKAHVLHRCDFPPCVNPDHLFLGDAVSNMKDRHAKGRYATGLDSWSTRNPHLVARGDAHGSKTHPERVARGERNGWSRLTNAQVSEIRTRLSMGERHADIAGAFGVHRSTVTSINRGRNWKTACDLANPRVEVVIEGIAGVIG